MEAGGLLQLLRKGSVSSRTEQPWVPLEAAGGGRPRDNEEEFLTIVEKRGSPRQACARSFIRQKEMKSEMPASGILKKRGSFEEGTVLYRG